MVKSSDYRLTIDLNTLKHLGIGLYSNIPAVVSEVVANSWDADSSKVSITIDQNEKRIVICDDGIGMSKADMNNKYLKVGYNRRETEGSKTAAGRHVMGRKGIGKLSLFSIAESIQVRSAKKNRQTGELEKSGFTLEVNDIEEAIRCKQEYHPDPIPKGEIRVKKGTEIVLSKLKKNLTAAETTLARKLARRFSVIGEKHGFTVAINGRPLGIEDRDYFRKIEYLWYLGEESKEFKEQCTNLKKSKRLDNVVDETKDYRVTGWVGTLDEQKSVEPGNNTIVILAWGKLIQEDILKDLKEGGIFTKYLIGEIRADFLDSDEEEDIATSDRQSLKEDDPRFLKLKMYIQTKILKNIQSKWREWRNEQAEQKALENPKIKEWFEQLTSGNKKIARSLFGKIESFPIEDPDHKRELYRHGILAFETLALRDNLEALESVDSEKDFGQLASIVSNMDALESVHYWQITKNRLAVLKKFESIAPTAQERVIRDHIFDHLWLLDASWERASTDARMEESVTKEWHEINAHLSRDEKRGRIDIRYRTAAGKHIIIELKKYDFKAEVTDLVKQIGKYRRALEKCLVKADSRGTPIIEAICILGSPPKPVEDHKKNMDLLKAADARYITYEELIQHTRQSYGDYLKAHLKLSSIEKLLEKL